MIVLQRLTHEMAVTLPHSIQPNLAKGNLSTQLQHAQVLYIPCQMQVLVLLSREASSSHFQTFSLPFSATELTFPSLFQVIYNNLCPQWNEFFRVSVCHYAKRLLFRVKDQGGAKRTSRLTTN